MRIASSVLVDLPRAGVVARVERASGRGLAERQVQAALHFFDRRAPVVQLVRADLQPLCFAEGIVTLWTKLEARDEHLSDYALGRFIRDFHDRVREPPAQLPSICAVAECRERLDMPSATIPAEDRAALRRRLDRCVDAEALRTFSDPLGTVMLHGDLHRDNIIMTDDGPCLVDLETAGVGPASWDLLPYALALRHYGLPEEQLLQLLRGYGEDPRKNPGFDQLLQLYELLAVSWTIMVSGLSPRLAQEARRRVDTVLGRAEHRWVLL